MRCESITQLINKRVKTTILTIAFAAAFLPVAGSAMAQSESPDIVIVENDIVVVEPSAPVQAAEVIPESKIARKMTQAEKEANAAENDSWGGAITIIAMCIVLSALIVLSVLFLIFGKISEAILTNKKKKAKAAASHAGNELHDDLAPGEVIAAIAMALSEHFAEGHDVEDTILTIRRLQKAYSPWNSKIYNLRLPQEHRRNESTEINFHESKRIQI